MVAYGVIVKWNLTWLTCLYMVNPSKVCPNNNSTSLLSCSPASKQQLL